MDTSENTAEFDELVALVSPETQETGFQEIDEYLNTLVLEFELLSKQILDRSSKCNEVSYFEMVMEACRLARRIRLRLGNPRNIPLQFKEQVVSLFRQTSTAILIGDTLDVAMKKNVERVKENISIRAQRLENPEVLVREFYQTSD